MPIGNVNEKMAIKPNNNIYWLSIIILLILIISILHYTTPTSSWQYHLVLMQSYFIPILIAAFQFGIRGGLTAAIVVTIIYFPHIMLQWGGLIENNLMRFLQIILFNIIGFLTGLKAQREKEETKKYKQTAEQLEKTLHKIQQQADALGELENRLRQMDRLAVAGELTSSLAHEVRNPLGSIRGAVEIIRDEKCPPDKKREFSQILVEETNRLSAVLENYLGFTKKKKQPYSDYFPREIINNAIMMLGATARKRQIEIKTEMPAENVALLGDSTDLWQVIMNILLNAIQSISDSGIITVSLSEIGSSTFTNNQNQVNAGKDNRSLTLTVSDTGSGISTEDIKNIFKPFYTTKKSGSGLGLAIVKRIIDRNNWTIQVNSKEEYGTEFVISIPVKKN